MGVHTNHHYSNIMNKLFLLASMLATCTAAPQGKPYPAQVEDLPPQPYGYQYGVEDEESKASFQKTESQDANGAVLGQYVIALPDGRIQTTKYTADPIQGFVAEVTYSGNAVYPPVKPGQLAPAGVAPYVPVGYLG